MVDRYCEIGCSLALVAIKIQLTQIDWLFGQIVHARRSRINPHENARQNRLYRVVRSLILVHYLKSVDQIAQSFHRWFVDALDQYSH